MEFYSYGFVIGPFLIHYYSLCFLAGVFSATLLASRTGKKRGIAPDTIWSCLFWLLIAGIIGARLWHVFLPSKSSGLTLSYYLHNPVKILQVCNGGLGIPGAILGGYIGLWLFCRKYGFKISKFTDTISPGLALGQAIGRLGNYFNQELYGAPSDLPWAITIDPQYRIPGFEQQATYHPLFLYELIYNLLNMGFLLWVDHRFGKRLKDGDIFLIYLIVYPVGRFFLEFLRLDTAMVGGLDMNQLIMGVTAVCAAAGLIIRHTFQPKRDLTK